MKKKFRLTLFLTVHDGAAVSAVGYIIDEKGYRWEK
jgi:hypothetical protein